MPTLMLVPQLVRGVPLGGVNCTCAAAAMCVEHATGGKARPSAAEVRARCRDKDGSPDTAGGTSLSQVADAVARGWKVDLDVRTPMRFEAMWDRLADPELIAIVQIRYMALHGSPAYALKGPNDINHAIVARRNGASAELFDPLADGRATGIPRAPVAIPDDLLRTAAGRLTGGGGHSIGDGQVYVAFARAPAAVAPSPTATAQQSRQKVQFGTEAFFVYDVAGGSARRESKRFAKATSAPGEGPVQVEFNHRSRRLVKITGGVLAGRYVEPGRNGVELLEHGMPDFGPDPGESLLPADPPEEPLEIPNDDVGEELV